MHRAAISSSGPVICQQAEGPACFREILMRMATRLVHLSVWRCDALYRPLSFFCLFPSRGCGRACCARECRAHHSAYPPRPISTARLRPHPVHAIHPRMQNSKQSQSLALAHCMRGAMRVPPRHVFASPTYATLSSSPTKYTSSDPIQHVRSRPSPSRSQHVPDMRDAKQKQRRHDRKKNRPRFGLLGVLPRVFREI